MRFAIKNMQTEEWLASFQRPMPSKTLNSLTWTKNIEFATHFNSEEDINKVIDMLPKKVRANSKVQVINQLSWPDPEVSI
jgi:hypothetical protein